MRGASTIQNWDKQVCSSARIKRMSGVVDQDLSLSSVGVWTTAFLFQPSRRCIPWATQVWGCTDINPSPHMTRQVRSVDNVAAFKKYLICGCLHTSKYVYSLLIRSFFGCREAATHPFTCFECFLMSGH